MQMLRRELGDGIATEACRACTLRNGETLVSALESYAVTPLQRENLERNREEQEHGATCLSSHPISISADLWYDCNFQCVLCGVRREHTALHRSEIGELFGFYAERAAHLHVSGGEPLLHPALLEFLGQPKKAPGALSMTTNGARLSTAILTQLLAFHFVNLHISLDSFDPTVFSALRAGGSFREVLAAVRRAVDFKAKAQAGRWYVALNVVPVAMNIAEMPQYLRRAADLGVDAVDVCRLEGDHPGYDFCRYPDLLRQEDRRAIAREIEAAIDEVELEITGFGPILAHLKDGVAGQPT
jgi:molybdenum cofactor biosynthesis enzyme MoaA